MVLANSADVVVTFAATLEFATVKFASRFSGFAMALLRVFVKLEGLLPGP